jgi:large subunit ribosomal protein L30
MAKDRDLVSEEKHELDYLLKKWDKRQNQANRDILTEKLKDFKIDKAYSPHNRENFYKYVDDKGIKELLDKIEPKKPDEKVPVKKTEEKIVPEKKEGKKIRIRLIRSTIGKKPKQRRTIAALGLRKINSTTIKDARPEILGMINVVRHLVEVEEVS